MWIAALFFVPTAAQSTSNLARGASTDVVEVLATVTRQRPAIGPSTATPMIPYADPRAALTAARTAVDNARQTGEARFWGRAQASLQPWWDVSGAPVAIVVMQATVQQGRHEFAAAEATLNRALNSEPGNTQAWLSLAALQRLSGRYADASRSCERLLGLSNAERYAKACLLETRSMQGRWAVAHQGLRELIAQTSDPASASWMLSLLAESQERAGLDESAHSAFAASLARMPDLYTRIAHSDLLLRTGKPQLALQLLSDQPASDAVTLRRAMALKRLGDIAWRNLSGELREREKALALRGDDPLLNARELAMVALWLDADAPRALKLAKANLKLQREPIDWWVALTSASAANDSIAMADLLAQVQACGLVDTRLTAAAIKKALTQGLWGI